MALKVLVIEDDADLREVLPLFFSAVTPTECVVAASVSELRQKAADALGTELAFIDINLGVGQPSGIDALAWLREHAYGGRVMFMTGHADHHPLVVEARRLGDITVLTKPVVSSDLTSILLGVPA